MTNPTRIDMVPEDDLLEPFFSPRAGIGASTTSENANSGAGSRDHAAVLMPTPTPAWPVSLNAAADMDPVTCRRVAPEDENQAGDPAGDPAGNQAGDQAGG